MASEDDAQPKKRKSARKKNKNADSVDLIISEDDARRKSARKKKKKADSAHLMASEEDAHPKKRKSARKKKKKADSIDLMASEDDAQLKKRKSARKKKNKADSVNLMTYAESSSDSSVVQPKEKEHKRKKKKDNSTQDEVDRRKPARKEKKKLDSADPMTSEDDAQPKKRRCARKKNKNADSVDLTIYEESSSDSPDVHPKKKNRKPKKKKDNSSEDEVNRSYEKKNKWRRNKEAATSVLGLDEDLKKSGASVEETSGSAGGPVDAPIVDACDAERKCMEKVSSSDINDVVYRAKLGRDQQQHLFRQLGIPSPDVENAERRADTRDFKLQAIKVLESWRQTNGEKATRRAIIDALKECGFIEAEEIIEKQWSLISQAYLSSAFSLEECKKQLITFYRHEMSRVQLLPWCDESKDMNDIYVTLKLKKGSRKGTTLLKKNEDLVSLQKSDGMPATRILVKGVAGSGKSTLLAKLAYTWSEQRSDSPLAKYQLLFILSLREVKSVNLIDEIFEQIFESNTNVSREGLEAYIESNPQLVLLMLDGFDEYSAGDLSTLEGSLQEILAFKRLRECHTILSTRPHKDLQIHQSSYLIVDVLGFSCKNVELYMNRFFSNKKKMVQGLKERIKESERLTSLSKIPVMLMLMCLLWEDEQKLRDTQSELYQDFVLFLWRKYCMRQGKDVDKTTQIEGEFPVFIYRLGCLALEGLCPTNNITEERLVFAENDFEDSSYQLGCKTGLLTRERIRSRLSVDNAVTFLHKSFQEFCAAKYWASLYTTDPGKFNSILIQLKSWTVLMSKFDLVKFCCGLVERIGMVSIIQHAIKVYEYPQLRRRQQRHALGHRKKNFNGIVNILTLLYESKITFDDGESRDDPDSDSDSDSDSDCSLHPSQKDCETVKSHQSTICDVLNTSLIQSFKSIFPDVGLEIDIGDKYSKAISIFHNFVKSELGSSILSTVKSITLINAHLHIYVDMLRCMSNVKSITLINPHLSHIYADMLLRCIPNVDELEMRFFESDQSREQNTDHLVEALGTVTLIKLSKLQLYFGYEHPIKWLREFLTACRTPNLQELHLQGIGMARPLAQQLFELQLCTQFISLNLAVAGLEENHIKTLSEFLPKIPNLQKLNLSHNTVGMAIVPLAQQLQYCPLLSELILQHAHIPDQGVIELSHRFVSMTNLTRLDLYGNGIGNTGVDALFRHIHHLTKLEYLSINPKLDNQCSDLVKDCLDAIGIDWAHTYLIDMNHAKCQLVQRTASKYLD
ncbi:NLR family CARD domain-containing protein 4-like [Amphiura filiformis]|uniref:NLR family CARD domain-containing protein 4-like n=1 Tax=Amphiura filiformis TaxID=82378 RepID=UPI003B2241FE